MFELRIIDLVVAEEQVFQVIEFSQRAQVGNVVMVRLRRLKFLSSARALKSLSFMRLI